MRRPTGGLAWRNICPRAALSGRELEVLTLIAKGLRNKEIGAQLAIAEPTVKLHVKNIFDKLNVIDRTQAVVMAMRTRQINP